MRARAPREGIAPCRPHSSPLYPPPRYNFQTLETIAQPGSLESERGIFSCAFDLSGSRLITGEADKTIKIWKEDADATPESHPINWQPPRDQKRY